MFCLTGKKQSKIVFLQGKQKFDIIYHIPSEIKKLVASKTFIKIVIFIVRTIIIICNQEICNGHAWPQDYLKVPWAADMQSIKGSTSPPLLQKGVQ